MPSGKLHYHRGAVVAAGILHRGMDQPRRGTFLPRLPEKFRDLPVPQAVAYTVRAEQQLVAGLAALIKEFLGA